MSALFRDRLPPSLTHSTKSLRKVKKLEDVRTEMNLGEESQNARMHSSGDPPPFPHPPAGLPVSSTNDTAGTSLALGFNISAIEYRENSMQPSKIENQDYGDVRNAAMPVQFGTPEGGASASAFNGYHSQDQSQNAGQGTQATTSSMFNYQGDSLSPEHPQNQKIMPVVEGGKEYYYCHLCSFCGADADALKCHLENHFEHRCISCDYTARTEGRLKQHIQKFHQRVATSSAGDSNEEKLSGLPTAEGSTSADGAGGRAPRTPVRRKVHRCKQCEFTCINKIDFWAHARTHIKEDKILQCPKCAFVTEYKHHLEYHLRNHFGSKPYKCQKCNYTCVNKSMLNSHMKSHTSIYQYRCASCTYATKYCHSLKLHLRKYDHKPASILNLDGTVEHDTSSLLTMKRSGPKSAKVKMEKKEMPERATHPNSSLIPRPSTSQQRFPPPPGIMPFWNPAAFGADVSTATPPPLMPMMGQLFRGMVPNAYKQPSISQESPLTNQSFGQPSNREEYNAATSKEEMTPHRPMNHGVTNPNMFGLLGNLGAERLHNGFMWPRPDMFGVSAAMKAAMSLPPFTPPNHMPMGGYMRPPQPPLAVPKDSEQPDFNAAIPPAARTPVTPVRASTPSNGPTCAPAEAPLDLTKSGAMDTHSPEHSENSRKRSRKGKAFKLDALCLKLQEKMNSENGDSVKPINMFNSNLSSSQSVEEERNRYPSPTASGDSSSPKALDESNNNMQVISKEMGGDNSDKLNTTENNNNLDESVEIDMEETDESDSNEKFTCAHCDIIFGNCAMYTMHMGYHGYQNPFVCNMCGEESVDKVAFFCHIARAGHS